MTISLKNGLKRSYLKCNAQNRSKTVSSHNILTVFVLSGQQGIWKKSCRIVMMLYAIVAMFFFLKTYNKSLITCYATRIIGWRTCTDLQIVQYSLSQNESCQSGKLELSCESSLVRKVKAKDVGLLLFCKLYRTDRACNPVGQRTQIVVLSEIVCFTERL